MSALCKIYGTRCCPDPGLVRRADDAARIRVEHAACPEAARWNWVKPVRPRP